MSVELIAILALVAIFAVATVVPINMGALGFVAAFVIGTIALDLTVDELVGGVEGTDATGFPSELVITLIGVTYLFAIARNNGSVDLIVRNSAAWSPPSRPRRPSSESPSRSQHRSLRPAT
ncbi:hypothetical protein BH24ACT12_BH24ACT12_16390 [soil metagenome]|jgi:hypothetical protein